MPQQQKPKPETTDDAFLRVCEVLGIQASRFSYLDAAAIRADRDRLHVALTSLLRVCADADPEEAIFPQQMEAARRALADGK